MSAPLFSLFLFIDGAMAGGLAVRHAYYHGSTAVKPLICRNKSRSNNDPVKLVKMTWKRKILRFFVFNR
ncbi:MULTISPECIES: hypothetical protein [unclassified Pseudomonas]|uniref:hypothetical protein n=1 Tax=unclassified Pseudomonas TaxID=196821 RepID=UPI00119F5288|nr:MULTISPECIES: hypothetical protein [unclassified Pseudomonas]